LLSINLIYSNDKKFVPRTRDQSFVEAITNAMAGNYARVLSRSWQKHGKTGLKTGWKP
jgi:hypothetical protein